jgi:DNA-binding HxlR family transcriptional regulator
MHGLIPGAGAEGWRRLPPSAPLVRAIDLIGDRWVLLIVYHALFHRTTRFGDFCRELGIPTNVLTRRLQALVQAGVLDRADAPRGHSLHEYRLTAHGERLWPVLAALHTWGEQSPTETGELGYGLAHRDCGAPLVLGPTCPHCKADIKAEDLAPG